MEETIDLWDAIREMRKMTSEGRSFSFAHATYDFERNSSHGIRYVNSAQLRPAARGDDLVNADDKLFYYDQELREPRNCWQILIMYFENQRVIVN